MAFLREEKCSKCGKEYIEVDDIYNIRSYICGDCYAKIEKEKYWVSERRYGKTFEERIAWIEE